MPSALFFGEHAQNDADHRHRRADRSGGQERDKAAAALHIGQADDPAGDAGADDGAHDDRHGLPHLHHAGVDKADHHDGGRGGGLDDRSNARAEKNTAHRGAGQLVQHKLELAAGDLFQSVPHQGHAEEKERHAAEERDDIGYTHRFLLLIIL